MSARGRANRRPSQLLEPVDVLVQPSTSCTTDQDWRGERVTGKIRRIRLIQPIPVVLQTEIREGINSRATVKYDGGRKYP